MLVHSFLYYQLGDNVIDDFTFDMWSIELVELMQKHRVIAKRSVYYNDFKEFDGSSGFDLPFANPEVQSKGYQLLKIHKERR